MARKPKALLYVLAQRGGEAGVVFLLGLLRLGVLLLDDIDLAERLLVGRHTLHDAHTNHDKVCSDGGAAEPQHDTEE